jgi:Fe-S-cluster containining protein
VEFHLAQAIKDIKIAMMETAHKADKKHLSVYQGTISCKPGCDACCSRLVGITIAEAVVIHDYLNTNGKWAALKPEVEAKARLSMDSNSVSWLKMNVKCPLLQNKKCSAYLVRPPACSTHFSVSDPSLCDPWSTKKSPQIVEMIEFIESFNEFLDSKLNEYGVLKIHLPLPAALLLAEKIQKQTNKSISQTMDVLIRELK